MSINEYVKFMTQTVVQHFERSPQERKTIRQEKKDQKPPMLFRWFGIVPYALMLLFKRKKS
ncbi:YqzE family protein [Rossellomorea sp. BNER]|uniref:YqzE family protein n=1 Tax=Rossellomorea sp. BNER TaxID=2962031 RepID=UPI003AF20F04|nr:YqzE family protein [Rossellomorea sp. BNER]